MQQKDATRVESKRSPESRRAAEDGLASVRRENTELRKSLAKLDVLFESLPSIFAIIQGGKVKAITPKGLQAFGYGREEIQGMDFSRLVHADHRPLFSNGYEGEFGGNRKTESREVEMLAKDGETVRCDLTFHKISYQGRAALLVEAVPSGARRERELNLIRSHKDELISMMSAGLVRKLTPSVQALNDYVARLKARTSPGRSPAQEAELVAAVSELTSLAHRLENLSIDENERARVLPFDLAKTVQDAISHLGGRLNNPEAAPINLQCYLRQASLVEGDPEEIRDAVVELINNAVEAMPEGGDLYITAEESAGYACVYIQDSGTSIPEEILPKITDPFFTTKGKGSDGLGLCTARAVLKRHHGDLQLESRKGAGTTITLRMPLSRGGTRQGRSAVKKRKNTWILIMEEDGLIRDLLFQVLSSKGYKVETAEVYSEGFEKLKSRPFDLVIAGTVTGDSVALIRRIRKSAPHASLALIGELGDGGLSGRLHRGSADLVIGKPIDMKWTLNRISELLIGRAK